MTGSAPTAPMTPLAAIQAALAGEHAALYVYGVVGSRVSQAGQPALYDLVATAYVAHRGRRDELTAMVQRRDAEPVAAEVSYELSTPCRTRPQLVAAARHVEDGCTEVYASTVGSTSGEERAWAVAALTDAAVRGLAFGAEATGFPGVPEL